MPKLFWLTVANSMPFFFQINLQQLVTLDYDPLHYRP